MNKQLLFEFVDDFGEGQACLCFTDDEGIGGVGVEDFASLVFKQLVELFGLFVLMQFVDKRLDGCEADNLRCVRFVRVE